MPPSEGQSNLFAGRLMPERTLGPERKGVWCLETQKQNYAGWGRFGTSEAAGVFE